MTYDPNLPPQLSGDSSFLNEEVRMKECDECEGSGWDDFFECTPKSAPIIIRAKCFVCDGTGEITMTPDDLREELENKKEKQSGLYNQ